MFYTKFRTDTCGVRLRNENTEIHTVFGIVSPSLAKQFQRDAHLDKHGVKTRLPDFVRCSPEGRRPNRQRERERLFFSNSGSSREMSSSCRPFLLHEDGRELTRASLPLSLLLPRFFVAKHKTGTVEFSGD